MRPTGFISALVLVFIGIYVGYLSGAGVSTFPQAGEEGIRQIELAGAVTDRNAEISGMAWHGDMLVLLPQYPERFGAGDGVLFAIEKQEILNALNGEAMSPITPREIKLNATGLQESIADFQGYEAIGFAGERVFLTIEAGAGANMRGYLVGGEIFGEEIQLDPSKIAEIPLPIQSDNHTAEALIVMGDKILTMFEINGAGLNPAPRAEVFDFELQHAGSISFPQIEYRVTDAAVAADGEIWVINYFFPGDVDLQPKFDPLARFYRSREFEQVERLVALHYDEAGMTLVDAAPVQIPLVADARNWEGLALLDERGFLVVTDKFPATILGFVER